MHFESVRDGIGVQRYHALLPKVGRSSLIYEAGVEATHELLPKILPGLQVPLFEHIPAEALVFIYPSRFCHSDLPPAGLRNGEFHQNESGFYGLHGSQLDPRRIVSFRNYDPTTSRATRLTELSRVCRDFAHLP